MKNDCSSGALVNRLIAAGDAMAYADNSAIVERTSTLSDALHYPAYKAEVTMTAPNYPGPLDKEGALADPKNVKVLLLGDVADYAHRPSEVLGDDITQPVLDAYANYAKRVAGDDALTMHRDVFTLAEIKQNNAILSKHRKDSGLDKVVEAAEKKVAQQFADDRGREEYGENWLKHIKGEGVNPGQTDKIEQGIQGNLTKNLLMNNIRAGLQNHLQMATTTLPQFGFRSTKKGFDAYRAAVKAKSPELQDVGGARFYEGDSRWDFFQAPEGFNQGVTYYTAKVEARGKGAGEAEAKLAGQKAVEQLQFKNRLGNEPRKYWGKQPVTRLSLLSYAIQMRRLHHSWWKGLAEGMKTGDKAKIHQNGRAILYFMGANALVNGVTASLPEEPMAALKFFAPKTYNALRQLDRFSLFGAIDADTAELSRISITPAGQIVKVPVLWDKIIDTADKWGRAFQHPSPKTIVSASKDLALLAPPVPIIGNKNLGNLMEYIMRSAIGDWGKYTPSGKKYKSDPIIEARAIPLGRPLSQNLENAKKDARRSKY